MERKFGKSSKRFLLQATALGLLALASMDAWAQTSSCAAFYTMAAGPYNVQTNYWNQGTCPGSQCLNISGNGDFTVTGNFNCAPTVATYPSIYYGCHYGHCTAGTTLPLQVSSVQCATSSWSFSPTNSGSWDAAYDIFLSPSSNTSNGPTGGAEIMIWLDYMGNAPPAGSQVGTVSIDGMSFTIWEGNIGWNYIAYLANSKTTSVSNLNILNFIKDSVSRGYVQNSWYLDVIEAGNEFRTGGLPFTSSNFSASVNNGCSGGGGNPPTATFTPTPSSTPTPTPAPAKIALSQTTGGPLSGYTSGTNIPMTITVCNAAGAGTASSVTVVDNVTNIGDWQFNGPHYGSWTTVVNGTTVTLNPTSTNFPLSWTVSNLPGGACVPIDFNLIDYGYEPADSCQVRSGYGTASWPGGGPVTSNTIAITQACMTATPTPTHSATPSATATPTSTASPTSTGTPSPTPSETPTATVSNTPTATASTTPTSSATPSPTITNSASPTPSRTPTTSVSPTGTSTPTSTASPIPSNTPTGTNTRTFTSTATPTATFTDTVIPTATATSTGTATSSKTPTRTPTIEFTATPTATVQPATSTSTATATRTSTPQPTSTPSSTPSLTPTTITAETATTTATSTQSPAFSPTATLMASATPTATASYTPTSTASATPTPSTTLTASATPTATATSSASPTPSPLQIFTPTSTATSAPSATPTPSASFTGTPSPTTVPASNPALYPNPATDVNTVQLNPGLSSPAPVVVQVFTLAFRKVNENSFEQIPAGVSVAIPLRDQWGSSLANGLYYVVVLAKGTNPQKRILKLLVIR